MWGWNPIVPGDTHKPQFSECHKGASKAMDMANYLHWKELVRVIAYSLNSQEMVIVLAPDRKAVKLDLKIMVDAEFAGDQDNRKSIMWRIIYLNDMPIGWNSKAMSGVTLSSTEAEYI